MALDKNRSFLLRDILHPTDYPLDDRKLVEDEVANLWLRNESKNRRYLKSADRFANYGRGRIAIIFSDGLWWRDCIPWIFPHTRRISVIGCNKVLVAAPKLDIYMANSPYTDVLSYLPASGILPTQTLGLFATRIYPVFADRFVNKKYFYTPPKNKHHAVTIHGSSFPTFEDFQTILVSAIHFAAWSGFNPIVLCSCDNSFTEERPGSIDIGQGRYIYPHHLRTYALIRGCVFWLQKHNIKVYNASAGLDIDDCPYQRIDKIMKELDNANIGD